MNRLRVRLEGAADDALVVVRGGEFDATAIRADAERTFRRFGERGVSVLAAPNSDDLDSLARTVLRRYRQLRVTTAGEIRRSGLEIRPTFRRPHYTVMLPNAGDVERLIGCKNEERPNPYYGREEAD